MSFSLKDPIDRWTVEAPLAELVKVVEADLPWAFKKALIMGDLLEEVGGHRVLYKKLF
jgi:hypothetical protein